MKSSAAGFGKTLLVVYLSAVHIFAGLFIYERFLKQYYSKQAAQAVSVADPTEKTEVPTPQTISSTVVEDTPAPQAETTADQPLADTGQATENANPATQIPSSVNAPDASSGEKIMIPVAGIKREQIRDTFNDARSEGRVHNANDIMAAGGTPVVACTDGEIAKFFDSVKGGITIYQYSPDRKLVYYYAHLQKRADNLKEHDLVKQGTIIGYVGDTGNAGAGNYHLHFAVTILDDPKNIFKGTDINPFPLLKEGIESR